MAAIFRNSRGVVVWATGLIFLALLAEVQAAPRIWTDLQGRQVSAEFVRMAGGDVVLKQPNGRVARVPLVTLSDADKEFIRTHLAAQGFRIWTSTDGRQIEAQYLRVRDGSVYVKFQGTTTSFPFDRLSVADRRFVRQAAASDDQSDQLPEPDEAESLPEPREWSDRSGQSAVGEFERILPDGRVMLAVEQTTRVVAVEELSEADHAYLRELLKDTGHAQLIPAEPEPEPEPEPPPPQPSEPPVVPVPTPQPPVELPQPPIDPPVTRPAPRPAPPPPLVNESSQPDDRSDSSAGGDLDFSMDLGTWQVIAIIAWLASVGGNLWIAAIAFQRGSPVFGVLSVLCCCPAALIFGISNSDECAAPLGLMVLGIAVQVIARFMIGMPS